MSKPLKVLLSAYACRPGAGSEPEVGWQWALQAARVHDVIVLTRAKNRAGIERGLSALSSDRPRPKFVYHDARDWLLKLKAAFKVPPWLYYLFWQQSARSVIARLNRETNFDLLHHVTWGEFRSTPAVCGQGVRSVWGPINGFEATPWSMLPWKYPTACLHECCRNLSNLAAIHSLQRKASMAREILVSTRETQAAFDRLGIRTILFPETGCEWREPASRQLHHRPLRLLYAGRIVFYKGVHLAVAALAASATNASLTIVGSGEFRRTVQRLARKLGMERHVTFQDTLPRTALLQQYAEFDAFIFPSLHDSGGFAVIEAMADGLPIICLDCGGPALAVESGCGIKVPVINTNEVVRGLARAIRAYDKNRALATEHGATARRSVIKSYLWNKKGEQIDLIYRRVAAES